MNSLLSSSSSYWSSTPLFNAKEWTEFDLLDGELVYDYSNDVKSSLLTLWWIKSYAVNSPKDIRSLSILSIKISRSLLLSLIGSSFPINVSKVLYYE